MGFSAGEDVMIKKLPLALISVLLVYLASFFFVSLFYEYPIGDGWTYAKVAKHFYETGQFQILPWYGQSLIAQIGWAFLFLLPYGFSFSALHLSSAVMGFLAILFLPSHEASPLSGERAILGNSSFDH